MSESTYYPRVPALSDQKNVSLPHNVVPMDTPSQDPRSTAAQIPNQGDANLQHSRFQLEFAALQSGIPQIDWILKNVLPAGAYSVVFGPPGSGKTFLMIDIMAKIVGGNSFDDRRVKPGCVLYVAGEGGGSIALRINAALDENEVQAEHRLRFAHMREMPNIEDPAAVQDFLRLIKSWVANQELGLKLVVFDTLNRLMNGADENSNSDMSKLNSFIEGVMRELECAACVIHHPSKQEGSKDLRGASALEGAVSCSIFVSRPRKSEDDRYFLVRKQREGEDGRTGNFKLKPITLGADEDGDMITTCSVEFGEFNWGELPANRTASSTSGSPPRRPPRHFFSNAFNEVLLNDQYEKTNHRPHHDPNAPIVQAVWRRDVLAEFIRTYPSDDGEAGERAAKSAFTRAQKNLQERNLIMSEKQGGQGSPALLWMLCDELDMIE